MIKSAAVPLLAILAACSAEVENGETNVIETLSVNNLVITGSNTANAATEMEGQAPPPAQPAQTAAPVADQRDGGTSAAEPKQKTVRKPSTEAAAKPPSKTTAAPSSESEPKPDSPASTCTAEHREMGHC